MKKKIGFKIAVGSLLLILLGGIYINTQITVLDKISFLAKIRLLEAFQKVDALEWVDYDDIPQYENFGGLSISYKEEFLKREVTESLFLPVEGDCIEIHSSLILKDNRYRYTSIIIYMIYYPKERCLVLEPIYISDWNKTKDPSVGGHYYENETINQYMTKYNLSEDDIRSYQDYILYDVVLKTWVETYGGDYEKEKLKIERLNRIDNTFQFEE